MTETDASSVIDRSLLLAGRPPLSPAAEQYFAGVIAKYGSKLHRIVLMPNFSYESPSMPPSGVAYVFERDAPVFSEPFHPNKLCTWGVAMFKLSSKLPDRPLNEAYFADPSRRMLEKMRAALADEADGPSIALMNAATGRDRDDARWLPILGGKSNYASINRHTTTINNKRVEQWVLTISTALPRVSRSLMDIIERHEKVGADGRSETSLTVRELLAMPEMRYAVNLAKRNRHRAAVRIAEALDVDIMKARDYGSSPDASADLVAVPQIENLSYHVESYVDRYVYYAGCTSTLSAKGGGIILGRAPALGPLLLHGSPSGSGAWAVPRYFNAFPIGTGRAVADQKLYNTYERDELSRERNADRFAWRGDSRHNLRLDALHHARTSEFARAEEQLERRPAWGESELHVIIEVIAPSTRPVAAIKQRV